MKRHSSHKILLKPNNVQATYFEKCAGTARFTYNWGLAEWKAQYSAGKKPSAFGLKKKFNQIKRQEFPWITEVSKCCSEGAFANIGIAFQNFFKHKSRYPHFKKKGKRDSFTLANDKFRVERKSVRIPKLGWVRMTEALRFHGKILSATVSKHAGKWFIAIVVELDVREPRTNNSAVGIDLGITTFAACSDGQMINGPKPHKALLKRQRQLNKELSRRIKFGKNWWKTKRKLQRLHARIANIRNDFLHKLTTKLSDTYGYIMIEDLNVKGMSRTRLARSILDQGFSEFRRQLEYKAQTVIAIDRFFPSSKTCSECGTYYQDFDRGESAMRCCSKLNRDLNAARNILKEGLKTVGSTGIAYRLSSSGVGIVTA